MKRCRLACILTAALIIAPNGISGLAGQVSPGHDNTFENPDYLIMSFSSGMYTDGLPRTDLLEDPVNQSILRACSGGAGMNELVSMGIDSIESRLDRMCAGRVLSRDDSVFRPAFPFLTEAGRDRLELLADRYAGKLVGTVESILDEIRACDDIKRNEDFHLLWSLIIDQCWSSIWERLQRSEPGPPQVIWIVDPPHEYTVGTNFWQLPGASFVAATWSPNCDEHLEKLSRLRLGFLRAAWQMPVDDPAGENILERYGFLSDDGRFCGLTWHDSTEFASLQDRWRVMYSEEVAGILDLKGAARALDLPEGQTFVILLHEVAYTLFKRLDQNNDLKFSDVLRTGKPVDQVAGLVSVKLVRRPLPEDVVMELLMINGYHGSDEIVKLLREILEEDADNHQKRLFLGMSLYDLGRYDDATVEFQELAARTGGDPETKRLNDWSRIWIGHVYDAKGERQTAIKWYTAVADDGSPDSEMSFGQYRIGPIDAVTWAKKRMVTPFIWRRSGH